MFFQRWGRVLYTTGESVNWHSIFEGWFNYTYQARKRTVSYKFFYLSDSQLFSFGLKEKIKYIFSFYPVKIFLNPESVPNIRATLHFVHLMSKSSWTRYAKYKIKLWTVKVFFFSFDPFIHFSHPPLATINLFSLLACCCFWFHL